MFAAIKIKIEIMLVREYTNKQSENYKTFISTSS